MYHSFEMKQNSIYVSSIHARSIFYVISKSIMRGLESTSASKPSHTIVDLEDEDYYQEEVVKEIHSSTPKFVDVGGGGGGESGGKGDSKKAPVVDEESEKSSGGELHYRSGPPVVEDELVEFEVHVVNKEETSGYEKPLADFQNDSEVVREIQIQFDRKC
ncbi:hypothetical protein L1887_22523 [Cichorium endivia]|nr:hypothetical protein L1887_22523 [Cichorium endivia]